MLSGSAITVRSFFLSSAKRRLAWATSLVAAVFALLAITAVLMELESWGTAHAEYRDWITNDKAARCQRLYVEAKPHLNVSCDTEDLKKLLDCILNPMRHLSGGPLRDMPQAVQDYAALGCPTADDNGSLKPVIPQPPVSLVAYTWNRSGIRPFLPPAAFLALVALLFVLTDIARNFLLEPHIGWRRLTAVASISIGIMAPAVFIDWSINDPYLYFLLSPAIGVGVCATILYGRKVFCWVSSGFTAEAQSGVDSGNRSQTTPANATGPIKRAPLIPSSANSEPQGKASTPVPNEGGHSVSFCPACQAETEHDGAYCSLCGRNLTAATLANKAKAETKRDRNLTWLWWILGLAVVALSFIFRPGRATETLISALVQVAILVPLILLVTRKKK